MSCENYKNNLKLVQVFETTDGKLFRTEDEALEHQEMYLDLRTWYYDIDNNGMQSNCFHIPGHIREADFDDLLSYLKRNKIVLINFLRRVK